MIHLFWEKVGAFLAGPVGSALRVALGFVLAGVLAALQGGSWQDLGSLEWWQALLAGAFGVALPIVIAALNPSDPRFGKSE